VNDEGRNASPQEMLAKPVGLRRSRRCVSLRNDGNQSTRLRSFGSPVGRGQGSKPGFTPSVRGHVICRTMPQQRGFIKASRRNNPASPAPIRAATRHRFRASQPLRGLNNVVSLTAAVAVGRNHGPCRSRERQSPVMQRMFAAAGLEDRGSALAECGDRTSVAIVDRAGRLRVFLQGADASPTQYRACRRKAYTARTFRAPSADWGSVPRKQNQGQRVAGGCLTLGRRHANSMPARRRSAGRHERCGREGQPKDEACAKPDLPRVPTSSSEALYTPQSPYSQ